MKKNTVKMVTGVILLCLTTTAYCFFGPRTPAALIVLVIMFYSYRLFVVVASSVVIESVLFYYVLKNISYIRAILMSCVGTIISVLLGNIGITIGALLIYPFLPDVLVFNMDTFEILHIIVTCILMYVGSALLELFVIQKIFRYPYKDLWIPIFVGNLVPYILVAMFSSQPMQL